MAAPQDFAAFAGAIVHELRTPLSVIAGEVDLALARDRSPAAYRDALARIAERVAELVDVTCDFAFLGDAGEASGAVGRTCTLDEVLTALADRYGARRGHSLMLAPGARTDVLAGDAHLITGALALLVEHGSRQRRSGAHLLLRAMAAHDSDELPTTIDFMLEATPGGFSPAAWQALADERQVHESSHGALRLETAARIIRACGGSLDLIADHGIDRVLIGLRRATAPRVKDQVA
jgi:K+-sensing histidine kinase KdpD